MMDTRTFLSQPLLRLGAICSLPIVLSPLFNYLAVARYGSGFFVWFEMLISLSFLVVLPTLVIAPFLLFNHRLRPLAARSLVAAAVLAVAAFVGHRLGEQVRMAAFHRLAQRSASLVQAIRSYDSRHGTPPAELASLVPEFLPEIPSTGLGAYPRFMYYVGEKAARYEGNPWVLFVSTPKGGINFDKFMYFPLQNYPKSGYGGWLERVSDWAYLHE